MTCTIYILTPYKPVGREAGQQFDRAQLEAANKNDELRAKNRRIEIVLFYKNDKK